MAKDIQNLLGALGIVGSPTDLYEQALTHCSFGPQNYERLEYLGDAVLKFAVSQALYRRFPHLNEGQMTQVRARVVSDRCLAEVAERLELGSYLKLGPAERKTGGDKKVGTTASALEALFAAIYLQEGTRTAIRIIDRLLEDEINLSAKSPGRENSKALLQEFTQRSYGKLPLYRIVDEEGPIHHRLFTAQVFLEERLLGTGKGPSKKDAEQAAAAEALSHLEEL